MKPILSWYIKMKSSSMKTVKYFAHQIQYLSLFQSSPYIIGDLYRHQLKIVFSEAECITFYMHLPHIRHPLYHDIVWDRCFLSTSNMDEDYRSGYGLDQWEKALHSNVSFHWPSPYPEWTIVAVAHQKTWSLYSADFTINRSTPGFQRLMRRWTCVSDTIEGL